MSRKQGSGSARLPLRPWRRRRALGAAVAALTLVFVVATALGGTTATHDEQPPAAAAAGDSAAADSGRSVGLKVNGDRVRVVVESTDLSSATTAVLAGGGTVEATAGNLISALVHPTSLTRISQAAGVRYVRPPLHPVADTVTDEGVASSKADVWQTLGRTGAGVKVAIVDLGFNGFSAAEVAGDLPGSATTVDYCSGNLATGTSHGTAVAEIVHAMAPGAQLYLICIEDEVSLAQAEEYAKANGVTIVNHSVSWFDAGRGDGTGLPGSPDAIVADARANGILWVNSAGNYADSHWSGSFNDSNNDGFEEFSGSDEGQTFFIYAGDTACIALKWDSWPVTAQDYDLYLFTSNDGTLVASSTNLQNGTQPPTDDLCYTNTTGSDQWFFAAIYKFAATAKPRLDMFVYGGGYNVQYQTPAGSLTEPATSPNALAVGAICWQTSALEPYSSRGPTIDKRTKPDIAGPDSTSSPVYGGFAGCGTSGFTGSSASSPHVAGAAALVEQVHPGWTPSQVQDLLTGSAVDLGAAGKDNSFGSGKLQLPLSAPKVTGFKPGSGAVGTTVTVNGSSLLSATSVSFNGAVVTPTIVSDKSIRAVVPSGATSGPLTVTSPDGTGASTGVFKVTPKVTGFSPLLGVRGSSVEIDGASFTGATKVAFGSVAASYTVDDDATIHATVPLTATSNKITVTTPGGSGSSATSFVVTLPPTISGFTPGSGPIGTLVTVNGANLDSVTSATVNGTDAGTLTHVNAGQLKLTIPTGASTGKIAVTNTAGTGTSVADLKVTPKITGFTPALGIRGSTVTITGSSFSGASKVSFGNAASLAYTVDDDGQITATVPPTANSNKITVTTPSGNGSSTTQFVVTLPPTITGFSPGSGPVGTLVTVNGSNLDSVTNATINGQDVGTLTHINAGQLKLTIPPGATTGNLGATNTAGTTASTGVFKVTPKITGYDPPGGGARVGEVVEILGSGLNGSTIKFTGAAGVFAITASDTELTVPVPLAATTGPVTVTTAGGTATGPTFKVLARIDTVTPGSGFAGTSVTLTGATFVGVTAVKFNGVSAPFTVTNASTLKATVPTGATTGLITVTTPGGTASSPTPFTITPKVTNFSPASGATGTTVTVTGSAFAGDSPPDVEFNGTLSPSVTSVTPTSLKAVVPNGATSGPIQVFNNFGSGTSSSNFTVTFGVTGFSPASGPSGTLVTVTGVGFLKAKDVKFGSAEALPTIVSDTQLTVTVPPGATTGPITVSNGSVPVQSADSYVIEGMSITSIAPLIAPESAVITITGNGLLGATGVLFGTAPASVFSVQSNTTILAEVPGNSVDGPITVVRGGQQVVSSQSFTRLRITSLSTLAGHPGDTVTVTGAGFLAPGISVRFNGPGGTIAAPFSIVSDTSLTTTIPDGATNGPVYILAPDGHTTVPSPQYFYVFDAPAEITSTDPVDAPPGQTIQIYGSNFSPSSTVSFGGGALPVATHWIATNHLEVVVPNATSVSQASQPIRVDSLESALSSQPFHILAHVVLNEIDPNAHLIELRATTTGSLFQLQIENLASLPEIDVAAGALIVVHFNGAAGVGTEIAGIDSCTDPACFPNAYDVATFGFVDLSWTSLALYTDWVWSGTHLYMDFVPLVRTTPSGWHFDLATAASRGMWLPTNCGGVACDDAGAAGISVDWSTLTPEQTAARTGASDTDTKADWTIGPSSMGAPNP